MYTTDAMPEWTLCTRRLIAPGPRGETGLFSPRATRVRTVSDVSMAASSAESNSFCSLVGVCACPSVGAPYGLGSYYMQPLRATHCMLYVVACCCVFKLGRPAFFFVWLCTVNVPPDAHDDTTEGCPRWLRRSPTGLQITEETLLGRFAGRLVRAVRERQGGQK